MTGKNTNDKRGRLIISLDFELGWGSVENGYWKKREASGVYSQLRKTMAEFISFLDDREITLSWATVGAMVTERENLELDHIPQELTGKYEEFLNESKSHSSDGRDLYDMVIGAKTTQHVCSHTYSHVRFSYPGYSEDAITHDLLLSKKSKSDSPNPIESLVFPLNHDTTYLPLKRAGYKLGRSKPNLRFGNTLGSVGKVIDQIVLPPPVVTEHTDEIGMIHHSGSMFFNWPGPNPALRKKFVTHAATRGLKKAAISGEILHIWLHPYNLAEIDDLQNQLCNFLDYACELRDRGELEIAPMLPEET